VAGRFPLLTDDCVNGPLVDGLKRRGWDVARVVDVFGQQSLDESIMAWAVERQRVLVSTDTDCLTMGQRWIKNGRLFRLIFWQQLPHQRLGVAPFLAAFDAIAAKESAFESCIEYLDLSRHV
jgi:hypothetical protein